MNEKKKFSHYHKYIHLELVVRGGISGDWGSECKLGRG